jgi:DNA-binding SARP family transcriptional activator
MVRHGLIRLCGSVSIELDGQSVQDALRRGNELLLFAYLVLERGRRVSRDEAAAALWPERRPAHEDAALRTVLSRLRVALGPEVLGSAEGLFLRLPDDVRVDLREAQELVGAARRSGDPAQALELALRASAMLEQPLLPGFERPWIDTRRRHLADLWADATELVAWASLELGDLAGAVAAGGSLVDRAPLHEAGYRVLMVAKARQSNLADALHVYERLRTILRQELGAAPCAALRDLHAQLLLHGGDPPAQRPVALTTARLRRLTRSLASSRTSWEHLVRHDASQRVFEPIARSPVAEAWLICWMPGQDSGPHDHDISSGAITVLSGELTEERLTWGASASPPAVFRALDTFHFGPTDIHRVYHSGDQPSTAIHAFSPPLRGLGAYARGHGGELLRHPLGPRDEVRRLA